MNEWLLYINEVDWPQFGVRGELSEEEKAVVLGLAGVGRGFRDVTEVNEELKTQMGCVIYRDYRWVVETGEWQVARKAALEAYRLAREHLEFTFDLRIPAVARLGLVRREAEEHVLRKSQPDNPYCRFMDLREQVDRWQPCPPAAGGDGVMANIARGQLVEKLKAAGQELGLQVDWLREDGSTFSELRQADGKRLTKADLVKMAQKWRG